MTDPALPDVPVAFADLMTLAGRLENEKAFAFADRLLDRALIAAPDQPDALHLSGIVAFRLGRREEALAKIERAIARGIDIRLYLRNISEVHRALGRFDDAISAARRAIDLAPDDPVCLHNLAVIQYHRLELDDCIASAEKALTINAFLPGSHFQIAEALLLRGEWERGWDEYQWRFDLPGIAPLMPPTTRPRWDGTPFADETLLLVADQGFGDVIQFSRYIPWAAERCPNIAVASAAEMIPLLRQVYPAALLFTDWRNAPPFRAFRALSGLPGLHGTRPDRVPGGEPYLRADPARAAAWSERLDRLVPVAFHRIGIVWAGRPTHNNDRWRSATLADFAPLAALPGVALVALQKGPAAAQAGQYFGAAPLINIGAEIADYEDTMAILQSLDALVTVDTSVGHVAGAMGRPTFILLARAPDWRWLLDRTDTPWYRSVRLVRQTRTGAWGDVMAEAAALVALTGR
ncbi:MAG: tetratricopeptide repeat-containing glycosyltransferase family protein [Acetobacteraceae bacterium]